MCSKPLIYLTFIVVFLKIIHGKSIGSQSGCDGRSNCVLLKECGTFMNYIESLEKPLKQSFVEFLLRQQCGFQEGYPKVCCSAASKSLPSSSGHPSTSKKEYPACRAKNQCIVLRDCRPYMDLIRSLGKPLKSSVVDFLRAQQCGFQEGYPKVCCSLLPKSLNALKHARPESRPSVNISPDRWPQLGNDDPLKTSTELDLLDVIDTVTEGTVKPPKRIDPERLKEKAKSLNKAFEMSDFFDYAEPYDLFRRKRFNNDSDLEVEVR